MIMDYAAFVLFEALAAESRAVVQLAALSPRGWLLQAGRSVHAVQLEQPEVVIDAIRPAVAAAQEAIPCGDHPHA
jgi:hypothetical protein